MVSDRNQNSFNSCTKHLFYSNQSCTKNSKCGNKHFPYSNCNNGHPKQHRKTQPRHQAPATKPAPKDPTVAQIPAGPKGYIFFIADFRRKLPAKNKILFTTN